jgi:plasmid stabilization system protein ParE
MITQEQAELIMQWEQAKKASANAVELERNLRAQVVAAVAAEGKIGTNNYDLGRGYTLKIVKKLSYKIDDSRVDDALANIEKLGNEGAFVGDRLVKFKPELSISEYNKLDATNPTHVRIKSLIDDVLTISDASPTVEIVEPKSR